MDGGFAFILFECQPHIAHSFPDEKLCDLRRQQEKPRINITRYTDCNPRPYDHLRLDHGPGGGGGVLSGGS